MERLLGLGLLLVGCGGGLGGRPVVEAPSAARPDTGQHPLDTDYGLCLNEVMPANASALLLADGTTPDWVEIFNPTDVAVDLEGWTLSDDRTDRFEHILGPGLVVEPGKALLLYAVGDDDTGVSLEGDQLNFQLAKGGGEVALFEPDGDGQVIVYGAVSDDFSVARATDCCTGEGCLEHRFMGSAGRSNL